jgi:hypothetical protein
MIEYAPETFLCATSLTFSASATCHIHIQSPTIYSTIPVIYSTPILGPVSVPMRRSNSFHKLERFSYGKRNTRLLKILAQENKQNIAISINFVT